jgi:hypothetical protein
MDVMVALDVGGTGYMDKRIGPLSQIILYQWTFAVAFIVSLIPFIGDKITLWKAQQLATKYRQHS